MLMNPNINFINYKRFALWSLAGIYTYMLQYVILIWNFSNEKIGLSLSKKISPTVIVLIGVLFLVMFINHNKSFKDHFIKIVILFSTIVFIFLYQPEQQKLSHVPEYIALSFIVYYALKVDFQGQYILPLTFILTAYLGFIDELLQGINPLRYYGSEDMVVNSLAGLSGTCIIGIFKDQEVLNSEKDFSPFFLVLCIFMVAMLIILTTVNILALFAEAVRKTQFQHFPGNLLVTDAFSLIAGILFLLVIYFYKNFLSKDAIVLLTSITVLLEIIIGIVVLSEICSVRFF